MIRKLIILLTLFTIITIMTYTEENIIPRNTETIIKEDEKETIDQKTFQVKRGILCNSIKNREPFEEKESFFLWEKASFFTEITDIGSESYVYHVWSYYGFETLEKKATIKLKVMGNHWRTWSIKTLSNEGEWNIKVIDKNGNVLAEKDFSVFKRSEN